MGKLIIAKFAGSLERGPFLVEVGEYDVQDRPQVKMLTVPTLEAAARACREYIDDQGLGGSDWCGGQVFRDDDERECVAVVSYNGRVWLPGGSNPEGQRVPDMTREFDLT